MARFNKWLARKFKKEPKTKQSEEGEKVDISLEMPFLPAQRPSILTPTASQENVLLESTAASSAFFAKLPAEIRQQIYLFAFGKRRVHMDLQHNHYKKGEYQAEFWPQFANRRHQSRGEEGWYWESRVCLRNRNAYFFDDCQYIERAHRRDREVEPTYSPDPASLGLMGWLSACRQSYTETIDFFYTNNTFHIVGTTLPRFLPRLLLPQRLDAIKSVELVWNLTLLCGLKPEWSEPVWDGFTRPLLGLQNTFPNLRNVYLSIGVGASIRLSEQVDYFEEVIGEYESRFYSPLDSLVRAYGAQLLQCEVALSDGLQEILMERALTRGTGCMSKDNEIARTWRYWRPLPEVEESNEALGYWIRRGVEDTSREALMSGCYMT